MNDTNRLLIFLLLIGLLYALYKYQHLIFGKNQNLEQNIKELQYNQSQQPYQSQELHQSQQNKCRFSGNKKSNSDQKLIKKPKNTDVNIDNVSQLSLNSLENEDGKPYAYKQDSILGSLDSNSLLSGLDDSQNSNDFPISSDGSKNSSFFF